MHLVADVGGTNARLALGGAGGLDPASLRRYRGDDHTTFDSALERFLDEHGRPAIEGVCVAVAGPVSGDTARLTNRDWDFAADRLARLTGASRALLINDLTALGHATAALAPVVLRPGREGRPSNGQQLVVNAGTGFNTCAVVVRDGQRACLEAEEGHGELPLTLAQRLEAAIGPGAMAPFHSVEELFAGRGVTALHAAVTGQAGMRGDLVVAAAAAGDAEAGRTCTLYAELFGLMLRELTIRFMPRDGLWLAGSVARAMAPRIDTIAAAMAEAPLLRDITTGVPVLMIEEDMAGLQGCLAAIT